MKGLPNKSFQMKYVSKNVEKKFIAIAFTRNTAHNQMVFAFEPNFIGDRF